MGAIPDVGDVVLAKPPQTDGLPDKLRPVVIVSNKVFNTVQRDRIVVPLTTNLLELPYSLPLASPDLEWGRLRWPSRMRINRLTSIDGTMLAAPLARINEEKLQELRRILWAILG